MKCSSSDGVELGFVAYDILEVFDMVRELSLGEDDVRVRMCTCPSALVSVCVRDACARASTGRHSREKLGAMRVSEGVACAWLVTSRDVTQQPFDVNFGRQNLTSNGI